MDLSLGIVKAQARINFQSRSWYCFVVGLAFSSQPPLSFLSFFFLFFFYVLSRQGKDEKLLLT